MKVRQHDDWSNGETFAENPTPLKLYDHLYEFQDRLPDEYDAARTKALELLSACQSGNLSEVQSLLSYQAGHVEINYTNEDGQTALHVASMSGHAQIVATLLSFPRIDIDSVNQALQQPIHLAASNGHSSVVSLLLDNGAKRNDKDSMGLTPIFKSCIGGHLETMQLLIENGARAGAISTDLCSWTLVHTASWHGHAHLIPYLIQLSLPLNLDDADGCTPLNLAAEKGYKAVIKALINGGANAGIADERGRLPLHTAAGLGFEDCVELLIPVSKINALTDKKETPLYVACCNNFPKSVQQLLDAGADATIQSDAGDDALEVASYYGYLECVDLLLLHGATVRWANSSNALKLAEYKEESEVVKKLRSSIMCPEAGPYDTEDQPESEAELEESEVQTQTLDCKVYKQATNFVKQFNIEDILDHSYDVCFCDTCSNKRRDPVLCRRGQPPALYALPKGWVKFGISIPPRAKMIGIMDSWHVAFHGTKVENVEKILETGQFLMPGDVTSDGKELRPAAGHYDDQIPGRAPPENLDIKRLFFSPSIKYASLDAYAPITRWSDYENNERSFRVVFQVRIKPNSYDKSKETIGLNNDFDPHFKSSELEWSTKKRGVTEIAGLLVKIEPIYAKQPANVPDALLNSLQTGLGILPIKAVLSSQFTCMLSDGKQISLKVGDQVTIIDSTMDGKFLVRVKNVENPIYIPKSFFIASTENPMVSSDFQAQSACCVVM